MYLSIHIYMAYIPYLPCITKVRKEKKMNWFIHSTNKDIHQ